MSNTQWWPILCLLFYNRSSFTVKLKSKAIHLKKLLLALWSMEGLCRQCYTMGKIKDSFHFCDKCLMFSSLWCSHFSWEKSCGASLVTASGARNEMWSSVPCQARMTWPRFQHCQHHWETSEIKHGVKTGELGKWINCFDNAQILGNRILYLN